MKKMRFAAILTVCALLTGTAAMPAAEMPSALTASAQEPDDVPEYTHGVLTYHNWGDHIVIIKCDMQAESVEIPTELDGLPVTAIGDYAFLGCTNLTEITIPEGITSIGTKAFFDCKNLMEIKLPETLERIGYEAFEGTGWMIVKRALAGKVIVNDTLISGSPSMKAAIISNDITKIADHAFANFYDLDTVELHKGVTSIGQYTFKSCDKLTEITLPESLSELGKGAFMATGLTSVTLPETITEVPEQLCNGCADLSEVTLHNGITAIGGDAFSSCPSLQSITIPQSVTKLGTAAFFASGLTSVELPDSVTELGVSLFSNCEELTEARLPHGIGTIPNMLFNYCPALRHVEIPDTVTSIGENAFADTGLTTVTIPEGVTEIEWGAFENAKLATVYLPKSLTQIGGYAFSGCPLTDVYYAGTEAEWKAVEIEVLEDFESRPFENAVIHYESELEPPTAAYGDLTYIVVGDHVEIIGCAETAEKVEIPAEIDGIPVTAIAENAFRDNTALTTVILPDSLTSIGNHAFSRCSGLTSITIPEGMTDIGTSAFLHCSSLTSVRIPDSVSSIGGSAFLETPWLKAEQEKNPFVIVNGTLIDGSACEGDAVIPNDVKRINDSAFWMGNKLTGITIPSSVTSIGSAAFAHCINLTNITIPSSVTSIEVSTFSDCQSLTSVTLPESIRIIKNSAFNFCENLTDVNYSGTEEEWKAIEIDALCNELLLNANIHFADSFHPTVAPGNLNADNTVDASDAAILLTAAAASGTGADAGLTEAQIKAADLNADGAFDAKDAALILQYAAYAGTGGDMTIDEYLKQE